MLTLPCSVRACVLMSVGLNGLSWAYLRFILTDGLYIPRLLLWPSGLCLASRQKSPKHTLYIYSINKLSLAPQTGRQSRLLKQVFLLAVSCTAFFKGAGFQKRWFVYLWLCRHIFQQAVGREPEARVKELEHHETNSRGSNRREGGNLPRGLPRPIWTVRSYISKSENWLLFPYLPLR